MPGRREALTAFLMARDHPWMIHKPWPKQAVFLATDHISEVFYGGAAGGGKSDALLLGALRYCDLPNYRAILFRRTYADLALSGALMDRSKEWLKQTKATWDAKEKTWHFPSGASITFGYLENKDDHYRYMGTEWHYCAFDELTQFPEHQYLYLFSRLRRLAGSDIPVRMRSASNPGGPGHEWVKKRFLKETSPDRLFVPATLVDNPALDYDEYVSSLMHLDPITRAQLLSGDWDAYQGGRFQRDWFRRYRVEISDGELYYVLPGRDPRSAKVSDCWNILTCDPAATEKDTADYTAIVVCAVTPLGDMLVLDVIRGQWGLEAIVPRIAAAAARYEPTWVGIEATGFSWAIVHAARRHPGIGTVRGLEPEGKGKLVRATPAIIRCEQGQLLFPEAAPWLEDFEVELCLFTGDPDADAHDDQVDALAWAVQEVDRAGQGSYARTPDPERGEAFSAQTNWHERSRERGRFDHRPGLFGRH
jgi:predicted phage terminase large subunit-like protein